MTPDEFFSAVCHGMNWEPTPWRIEAFKRWAAHEGMPFERTWNPLATTWYFSGQPQLDVGFDIGYGPGNWNSVPVRVYATPADGIQATVWTLSQPQYYYWIRRTFEDQKVYQEAANDFSVWSGAGYSQAIVDDIEGLGEPGEEEMSEELRALLGQMQDQIRQLQDVLAGGPEGMQEAWDDQSNFRKGLGELQAKVAELEARPSCGNH